MNLDFAPEDVAFRDEVRDFIRDNLPAHVRDGAAKTPGVFVEPDIGLVWHRILARRGWAGHGWPVEDGGTGWSPVQRYLFEKECALAGAPALSVLGLKLIGPVLCEFGTPEQKARFLSHILSGEESWCQGYSEPGSGSDLASLTTSARRDGDNYVINGSKIWTTHAHHANWMFCLARTDKSVRKQAGISFLLVPMDQPGVEVAPIVTMAGDHEVNQVFLSDACTHVANRIGNEGQGWEIAKFLLENERGGSCHAPRLLQRVQALIADARHLPSDTTGAVADDPLVMRNFAKLKLEGQALEVLELRILDELAKGRRPGPQTSLIKLIASDLHQRIDAAAVDLHGYDALQLPLERPLYGNDAPEAIGDTNAQMVAARYLNSRAWSVFGGSSEVQKNIIAKSVLGL